MQMQFQDEVTQSVMLYCWMSETWTDEFLRWNPAEYRNQKTLILDSTDVWRPDTYLYNK